MVSRILAICFNQCLEIPLIISALRQSSKNNNLLIIYLCINYLFDHLQTYNMFIKYICLPSSSFPF